MFKKLFVAAAAATLSLGAFAQQNVYLIKGTEVVAKYNVADVDYVSFTLPAGVTDNTGDQPGVLSRTYQSASGVYMGTTDGVADYILQFSSREITDENPPIDFLYLQIMGPAADYHNLSLPVGTYTVASGNARAAFTYYPGKSATDGAEGSMVVERPDNQTTDYIMVEGGSFTVAKDGNAYNVSGMLKLQNGKVLEFSYTGAFVIDNESDEKDPADFLPLPESTLTENITVPTAEVYYGTHGRLFADMPDVNYNYIWCYDANYEQCLELGFFVKTTVSEDFFIPKGKYQVVTLGSPAMDAAGAGLLYPFMIKSDTGTPTYGAWMITDYDTKNPLVSGEVEVLEDFNGTGNLNIVVNLKDNAATPHTVSGTFNGKASKM